MKSPCDTCTLYPCIGEKEIPKVKRYCPFYHPKPKPQTNADRIRAMTDDGIEDWYWWMHKEMMRYTDSRVFVHDWLKSPVEVDK